MPLAFGLADATIDLNQRVNEVVGFDIPDGCTTQVQGCLTLVLVGLGARSPIGVAFRPPWKLLITCSMVSVQLRAGGTKQT